MSRSARSSGGTTRAPQKGGDTLGGSPTLRGTTSLINAYTPLYVVDGMVVSDARVPRGINLITRASGTSGSSGIATDQEQPVNRLISKTSRETCRFGDFRPA